MSVMLAAGPAFPPVPAAAQTWPDPCNFTGTTRVEACFSDPTTDTTRIFDSLGAMVATARPGDTIRIIMFHWRNGLLPEQLATTVADAYRTGVDVRVILDETSEGYRPLGILRGASVPVQVCHDEARARDGRDDCLLLDRGFYQPGSLLPMQHVKLFLFRLGGVPHIAAGSANLTAWDYQTAWNDVVRIRGDRQLHDWLGGYFDRVWADAWLGWDTNADRDRTGDPVTDPADLPERAWVYPRLAPGDPIIGQLAKVTGCHSDGDGDGDWDKRVWVAISQWNRDTRTGILDQLVRLDSLGCDVKVLVSDDVDPEWVAELRRRLSGGPAAWDEVRSLCTLHHKFIIIDAQYAGDYHEVVITGSHIFATGSLYYSGELSLRVGGDHQFDDRVVVDYISHFQRLFELAPADACP